MAQLLETFQSTISWVKLNMRTLPIPWVCSRSESGKEKMVEEKKNYCYQTAIDSKTIENQKIDMESLINKLEYLKEKCKSKSTYLFTKDRKLEKAISILSGLQGEE